MKRLTSDRRAAASRANGAKSRGPVTARGKYNSSLNSRRHGLLSRWLLLPGEMPELFQQQYDDFMEEHQPRTPTERALVEEMIASWWRKQRVWAIESARIQYQAKMNQAMGRLVEVNDPATQTAIAVGDLADNGRTLDIFLRYETRYERQFHRALARLLDLKSRDPEPDDPDSDNSDCSPVARAPHGGFPPSPNRPPQRSDIKIASGSPEPIEKTLAAAQAQLRGAGNPACSRLSAGLSVLQAQPPAPNHSRRRASHMAA